MKLRKEYLSTAIGGQTVLVPVGAATKTFNGVARLNETAGFIVDCLKSETTAEQIADALCAAYEVEPAVAQAHVNEIINKLREIGAIE